MPRRKKAASGDVAEEEPASKRSRGNGPQINGCSVQWQWEDDGEKWKSYSNQLQELVTDTYEAGGKPLSFEVAPKVELKVDPQRMTQKNTKTGWQRRVRVALKNNKDKDYHVWQWEDEKGRWNPYSAAHSMEFEDAVSNGTEEVSITALNRNYTINISQKEQTNDDTGVIRKMERSKVDVDEPSDDIVKVTSATSSAGSSKGKSAGVEVSVAKGSVGAKGAAKGSTGRGKSAGSKGTSSGDAAGSTKSSVKTVVMKGAAPVDPECTAKVNSAHVFSKGKDIYDAMLNQTNLSNNNNKYYLMQVLEDDNKKAYSVWFRWGRVGYKGQTTLIPCGGNLDDAIDAFCKKFYDKTRNDWASRSKFQKVAGKYDLVKMDYSTETKTDTKPKEPENIPDSKLEKRLQSLIELICDVKRMEEAVVEMKYDAKKAPLGKLTETQIKAGYKALKKIDAYIENNQFGSQLVQACDEFYTRIPHDFGMRVPPVIRTKADVKLKLSLLEALSDIEVAMKIIKEINVDENPLDTHYNSLNCDLKALDRASPDFKMIEDYLRNTHAATHNQYKMKILDVFDVDKDQEHKRFEDKGNRMLLWHGSRLTNWVGILSQGLRIAPPEAPVTGYMFGKGVYFADMSSKSANYCYPSQAKNEGLLLLCEVSLGNCNELLAADYKADKLPTGKHSVWGKGQIAPNPKKNFTLPNGCVVPLGKGVDTGVKNPAGYTLNYNEFIVYSLSQIKMKYLLRIEFDFK